MTPRVLREMLGGPPPSTKVTPAVTLARHIGDHPSPPCTLPPELPHGLEGAVMRLLALRPENRFAGGADLVRSLRNR